MRGRIYLLTYGEGIRQVDRRTTIDRHAMVTRLM